MRKKITPPPTNVALPESLKHSLVPPVFGNHLQMCDLWFACYLPTTYRHFCRHPIHRPGHREGDCCGDSVLSSTSPADRWTSHSECSYLSSETLLCGNKAGTYHVDGSSGNVANFSESHSGPIFSKWDQSHCARNANTHHVWVLHQPRITSCKRETPKIMACVCYRNLCQHCSVFFRLWSPDWEVCPLACCCWIPDAPDHRSDCPWIWKHHTKKFVGVRHLRKPLCVDRFVCLAMHNWWFSGLLGPDCVLHQGMNSNKRNSFKRCVGKLFDLMRSGLGKSWLFFLVDGAYTDPGDARSCSAAVLSRMTDPSALMPMWFAIAMDIIGCPSGMNGIGMFARCGG